MMVTQLHHVNVTVPPELEAATKEFYGSVLGLEQVPKPCVVHVSADNRYRLFVNGKSVSWGPARGDLNHWRFETVDLAPFLKEGGTPAEYGAGLNYAVLQGWLWKQNPGPTCGSRRPVRSCLHKRR